MKQAATLLMLLISVTGNLFAQTKPNPVFDLPEGFAFHKQVEFHLDNGNKFSLELADGADIQRVSNVDSLLTMYLKDISLLKDSLGDPATSKRIDYVVDSSGIVKIRILQYQPKSSSFLLRGNELSAMKVDQDTINIIGIVVNPPVVTAKLNRRFLRYYRLTFYINSLDELTDYLDGRLNAKVQAFQTLEKTDIWLGSDAKNYHLSNDRSITSTLPGRLSYNELDHVSFDLSVTIQNYKNYFVPSLNASIGLAKIDKNRKWIHGLGASIEPAFLFQKDDKGKLQTYVNGFISLEYSRERFKGKRSTLLPPDNGLKMAFSLGYLYHRQGEFYDKNTFRVGLGQFKYDKTRIQPIIYFSEFFKSVSPGIRLTQLF
jgi:hypothetical protein